MSEIPQIGRDFTVAIAEERQGNAVTETAGQSFREPVSQFEQGDCPDRIPSGSTLPCPEMPGVGYTSGSVSAGSQGE